MYIDGENLSELLAFIFFGFTNLGTFLAKLFLYCKVDRTGTKVTVVEQKENKDYTFQNNIMDLCVECLEKGVVPNPEVCNSVLNIVMIFLKISFSIRLTTQ